MARFSGDKRQILRKDGDIVLCRGWQGDDCEHVPMLAVLAARDDATPASVDRLSHEFILKDQLDSDWAARPLALLREHGRCMLVLEDPGGDPLDCLIGRPMDTARFLRLAIAIAEAVAKAHRRGIVHRDIKPAHVLVDEAHGKVRLTGFGIASRLPREQPAPEPPEVIAGTLAYMAPEQTGRMNRSVDSRSDLYSLGVTFYQMVTGVLPFAAADPMEWVHCHIARRPLPPADRVPGLPFAVSAIIMKCLAKTAEDRYQTAAGVAADLKHCLAEWRSTGAIAPFALAGHDVPDVLRIPEKLYGRELEVGRLIAAFERVVTSGRPELVLVSGYSGIGKSSVVHELHKAIVPARGFFASGKFDQHQRAIPYATLAHAFRTLLHQLLVKSEPELSAWREAIQAALGPNGQLVVDLVPELALLIGSQPPVPELGPRETENRFLAVLTSFLGVFARDEHPLVLFLDDLQWLDVASLNFLAHVVSPPACGHLLAIGAFRGNEVGPAHPLTLTVQAVRKAGGAVEDIVLGPLSRDDLSHMVAEALSRGVGEAEPLAGLVHERTAGNPFFARQFLTALSEEQLLAFDAERARWIWDLDNIRGKGFTDNVVELMVAKLERLPASTREALTRFACLGNHADAAALALVQEQTEASLGEALRTAVRAGLVLRRNGSYRFLHDRVQEAAYALIPEARRPAEHLRIGRLLLSHLPRETLGERVFEVVDQLNHGISLVADPAEQRTLFELNVVAGRKAKAAVAYASALAYFNRAMELLPPEAWRADHDNTFAIALDRAECQYLTGAFEQAEASFVTALTLARTTLDRARVFRLRSRLYQMAGRFDKALAVVLDALALFQITLPSSEPELRAIGEAEMSEIGAQLQGRSVAALIDAPPMTDPTAGMIISLLREGLSSSYATNPAYFPVLSAKAVSCSLRHGNGADSCLAYSIYAIVLIAIRKDIQAAFEFSELALALVGRFGNPPSKGAVFLGHGGLVLPWRRHIADGLPFIERGLAACIEAGDLPTATACLLLPVWAELEKGASLDDTWKATEKYASLAMELHHDMTRDTVRLCQRLVASLKGLAREPTTLDGEDFSEDECLAHFTEAGWHTGVAYCQVMKEISAFIYGRYSLALEMAEKALPVFSQMTAMPVAASLYFYQALAAAARYPTADTAEQQAMAHKLEQGLERHRFWAEHCPENFENRYALLAAEAARIGGRDLEAMRFYEQAIRSAHDNGFLQNEALASELAGKFYLDRGLEKNGFAHLRDARACYARWGADGKVRQLDRLHPQLAAPTPNVSTATIDTAVQQIDVAAMVKASQAVSGEIQLPNLIQTLMTIAVQDAGADRGLLILPRDGVYSIEAEARATGEAVEVALRRAPMTDTGCPETVLNYVIRTRQSALLDDVSRPGLFSADPYLRRGAARSAVCLPLVRQGKLTGVLYLENSQTTHVFTPHRISLIELLAAQAAISLENTRLYGDLQVREAKIRRLVDANIIGIVIWDLEGGISEANDAFLAIVGYDHEDVVAGRVRWKDMTPPEWRDADRRAVEQISATGSCAPFEKEYVRKDGSRAPVLVGVACFEGSTDRGVAFVLDLSERKQAEERQKLLLDELNHRVKNALATVLAISEQTFRTTESPEAFCKAFRGRVLALSQTHNLLNRSCWKGVGLREVLAQELAPLVGADSGRYLLSGDDVRLGPVAAVTVGMAFHELATNAAKFGSLSVAGGQVRVAWEADGQGHLHLDWQEQGGPPVQPPKRRGFGSRLIERVLASELGGEVHLEFMSRGVHCTMDMSLDKVRMH